MNNLTPGDLLNQMVTGQPQLENNNNYQQPTSEFNIPWESLAPVVSQALRAMQSRGVSLYSPSSVLLFQVISNQNELLKALSMLHNLMGEINDGEEVEEEEKPILKSKRKRRIRNR